MAYIAAAPEIHKDTVVGTGHCVPFVQVAAGAPNTGKWKKGIQVKGAKDIAKGTAIATFDEKGNYPNAKTGNHAAIYIDQDSVGINVWDQWVGRAVNTRKIRFKGTGKPSNDGDAFYVID